MVCLLIALVALADISEIRNVLVDSAGITVDVSKDFDSSNIQADVKQDTVQYSLKKLRIQESFMRSFDKSAFLKKIFIYQYTPDTVRVRITLDDKAEFKRYLDDIQISSNNSKIYIKIPNILQQESKHSEVVQNEKVTQKKESVYLPKTIAIVTVLLVCVLLGVKFFRSWRHEDDLTGTFLSAFQKSREKDGVSSKKSMKVISSLFVDQKKRIIMLQVPGKKVIIGVTGDTMVALSEVYDEAREFDDMHEKKASFDTHMPQQEESIIGHDMQSRIKAKVESLKQL